MLNKRVGIIGGGIIGLTTAVELAKHSYDIHIYDQQLLGRGASGAALGSLTPYSDHEASESTRNLAKTSLELYPELISVLNQKTGLNIEYQNNGVLELAISEEKRALLKKSYTEKYAGLNEIEWIDAKEISKREPNITKKALAGVFYKTESTVNVAQLLSALISCARVLGIHVYENQKVTQVIKKQDCFQLLTDKISIEYDFVIVCPGADLASINGLDIDVNIDKIRGEVVEVRNHKKLINSCVYAEEAFMTPMVDGRIFLGSNYTIDNEPLDQNINSVSVGAVQSIIERNVDLVPAISSAQLTRVWKSWRPKTNNGKPFIRCSPNHKNLIYAIGFYGLGITLAPAVARLVCEHVQN